jgi:hypothetical protein
MSSALVGPVAVEGDPLGEEQTEVDVRFIADGELEHPCSLLRGTSG